MEKVLPSVLLWQQTAMSQTTSTVGAAMLLRRKPHGSSRICRATRCRESANPTSGLGLHSYLKPSAVAGMSRTDSFSL